MKKLLEEARLQLICLISFGIPYIAYSSLNKYFINFFYGSRQVCSPDHFTYRLKMLIPTLIIFTVFYFAFKILADKCKLQKEYLIPAAAFAIFPFYREISAFISTMFYTACPFIGTEAEYYSLHLLFFLMKCYIFYIVIMVYRGLNKRINIHLSICIVIYSFFTLMLHFNWFSAFSNDIFRFIYKVLRLGF